MEKKETVKKKKGGYMKGGGRPKGAKNAKTLEKDAALAAFNSRIYQIADSLLTAQQSLAKGQQMLYRIDTVYTKGPKGGTIATKQKPVLVDDPNEIAEYIDSVNHPSDMVDPDKYYFITTVQPNNQAIDSLMNRGFGRPKETMEIQLPKKLNVDF